VRRLLYGLTVVALCAGQSQPIYPRASARSVLDAHNCYPYEGKYADRVERALALGHPVAIEQDLAWYQGKVVVSHSAKTIGIEPTLKEHFFERVRPLVEQALRENRKSEWPIVILHFDNKDNREPLLRSVWELLGEYEGWITTAVKGSDPRRLAPLDVKPLLVLTEDSDAQEAVYFRDVPVGGRLRVFGSAHTTRAPMESAQERTHWSATVAPEVLLAERPTNYRRWWNNAWNEVEEGGQTRAGDWTPRSAARLKALVDHAHNLGFWIRFYTLDGFTADENRGWDKNYNFGSQVAVEARWRAAIDAGVDLIATDQYESLAACMRRYGGGIPPAARTVIQRD
jgi:hypothetical protein